MVLTISGKKATSAAFTTFEVMPSPNQTMISGASATFGIAWNMTMNGIEEELGPAAQGDDGARARRPARSRTMKPSNVSVSVIQICSM